MTTSSNRPTVGILARPKDLADRRALMFGIVVMAACHAVMPLFVEYPAWFLAASPFAITVLAAAEAGYLARDLREARKQAAEVKASAAADATPAPATA